MKPLTQHLAFHNGCTQVIQELGGDAVDEALLTFQSMDHGETPRTFLHSENAGFVGQKNG